MTDLSEATESINAFEAALTSPPWTSIIQRYPIGRQINGTVMNTVEFGIFVEIEPGISGLVHSSRLPYGFRKLDQFFPGERVVVEIENINGIKRRIAMALCRSSVE